MMPKKIPKKMPKKMMAVVTTGNGGTDRLDYREVDLAPLRPGEVCVRVLAAGMNNTEINTRLGWYSQTVTAGTSTLGQEQAQGEMQKADGGCNQASPFPK